MSPVFCFSNVLFKTNVSSDEISVAFCATFLVVATYMYIYNGCSLHVHISGVRKFYAVASETLYKVFSFSVLHSGVPVFRCYSSFENTSQEKHICQIPIVYPK